MTTTPAERVAAGAMLLDSELPNWFEQISLDKLKLASTEECVLGQLFQESRAMPCYRAYGYTSFEEALADSDESYTEPDRGWMSTIVCDANYAVGCVVLGLTKTAAYEHGFITFGRDSSRYYNDELLDKEYAELDRLWTIEILNRQTTITSTSTKNLIGVTA